MDSASSDSLIQVRDLKKWFPVSQGLLATIFSRKDSPQLKAVDGMSFTVRPGEVLGLAGESGCGKTTTGMTVLKLYESTAGDIFFLNQNITEFKGRKSLEDFRKRAQIVFQNPYESLNPRFTVFQSVDELVRNHYPGSSSDQYDQVVLALQRAGLIPPELFLDRYPHELSGGQLQRVAIARAISVEPKFLVADEPVSMLDVSVRAGILNLLKFFSRELNMGILYISHDLSTMRYICDSIGIMYLGKIVEMAPTEQLLNDPKHPYTKALVAAIPLLQSGKRRERILLEGAVPNPINLPEGCRFNPRCPSKDTVCSEQEPSLLDLDGGISVACHKYNSL